MEEVEFEYKVITGYTDGLETELNGLAHSGWYLSQVCFDGQVYTAVMEREVVSEMGDREGPNTPFPQPHPAPQPGPTVPKNYDWPEITGRVNKPWQCGAWVYQDDSKIRCTRPINHEGFCQE